jgi:putative ABC transport system substrate-binding protein
MRIVKPRSLCRSCSGGLVVELIGLAPDLIVVNSTPALAALHAATTAIPVLFVLVVDPVGLGYIASLSRPGGNITGFSYKEVSLIGKWLDLLNGLAPTITRTAFLYNPDTAPFYTTFLSSFESAPTPWRWNLQGPPYPRIVSLKRRLHRSRASPPAV